MREGGKQTIKADTEVVSVAELKALKRQVRELERLFGKKTMENEILKDALSLAWEKSSSRARPCPSRATSHEADRRNA